MYEYTVCGNPCFISFLEKMKGTKKFYGKRRKRTCVIGAALLLIFLLCRMLFIRTEEVEDTTFEEGCWEREMRSEGVGDVKVRYVVIQTKPSPGWCRMLVSSLVVGIDVITIGLDGVYHHTSRPHWLLNYIESAGLSDDDVIVTFDGADTVFVNKHNLQCAISKFISTTPSKPENFDEEKILKGVQKSPLLFTAERGCFASQLSVLFSIRGRKHEKRCERFYRGEISKAKATGAERVMRMPKSGRAYLNAGGVIGRVWAFKEAIGGFSKLREKSDRWWCDQTIWTILFAWSVNQQDTGGKAVHLRKGLISLDYDARYFLIPSYTSPIRSMILHFSGLIRDWKWWFPGVVRRLVWIQRMRDDVYQRDSRSLLTKTSLTIYGAKGEKYIRKFADVCNVDEAVDYTWLSTVRSKH
ncbi:expression site-associated gene (ESAG) protein, putative [Trypanosoma brucei brucei TREU927]|uniref:Expression site-associated gene (ESAG) protein, putative n=2 Tax=Trypanozoon TaxID=39700 RepID=Q38A25_TRYB2|nr:expression site-associated gene ESAG protein [Trypanosoma brucei brucei TREU927]EAN78345.1 expression site-associated gene (ESAG) protein, putative [Trypanosoma brucei brucei TREU927]